MTCPACQAEVPAASAFCPKCGAATGVVSTSTSSGAATAPAVQPVIVTSSGLSPNAAAALAYVTIIPAIIFLVMEPYNRIKLVKFHAVQCIGLFIAAVAVQIIAAFIPILGWLAQPFIALAVLIIVIICILKASKGEFFKLPIIGDFAEKQANT